SIYGLAESNLLLYAQILFSFLYTGISFPDRNFSIISAVLLSSLLIDGVRINFFNKAFASSNRRSIFSLLFISIQTSCFMSRKFYPFNKSGTEPMMFHFI